MTNSKGFSLLLLPLLKDGSIYPLTPFFWTDDSHGNIRELLLGEVEGVIGHRDAVLAGFLSCRQISPQDGVVGHTDEGHHAVPGLVVEPHLPGQRQALAPGSSVAACRGFAVAINVS